MTRITVFDDEEVCDLGCHLIADGQRSLHQHRFESAAGTRGPVARHERAGTKPCFWARELVRAYWRAANARRSA